MNLSDRSRPSLWLSPILATLLLVQAAYSHWQTAVNAPALDFFTFWSVPHVLAVRPVASIYSPDGQRVMEQVLQAEAASPASSVALKRSVRATSELYDNQVEATGSPLLYALLGVTSSGDFASDLDRFALVSFLCLVGAVALACWVLRFSVLSTLLTLIVLISSYVPVVLDVSVGNINQIQLLLITLFVFLTTRSWRFVAGATLGAGIMLKPNTAVIAVLCVLLCLIDRDFRRQRAMLAGAAIAALVCFGLSSWYFGSPDVWLAFAHSLVHTLSVAYPFEAGNYGLTMLLYRLTGRHVSLVLLTALLGLFVFVAVRTRRTAMVNAARDTDSATNRAMHEAFAVTGIGSAIMLLSSNLAWMHYFVLLIPVTLYLIRPEQHAEGVHVLRRALLLTGPFLILSTLAFTVAIAGGHLAAAALLNAAALLVLGLVLREMWRQRVGDPPSPEVAGREVQAGTR